MFSQLRIRTTFFCFNESGTDFLLEVQIRIRTLLLIKVNESATNSPQNVNEKNLNEGNKIHNFIMCRETFFCDSILLNETVINYGSGSGSTKGKSYGSYGSYSATLFKTPSGLRVKIFTVMRTRILLSKITGIRKDGFSLRIIKLFLKKSLDSQRFSELKVTN